MIVDGKQIASEIFADIKARIAKSGTTPELAIITCAPNFETKKYLALKEKKAAEVGISISVIELEASVTTEDVQKTIAAAASHAAGIIVQFPLPAHIDATAVAESIPSTHDVDALSSKTEAVLTPVVGAFKEILDRQGIEVAGKLVTVLGSGRLVGQPAAKWFTENGAAVSIVTKDTTDVAYYTKQADIIACGAGDPGFLKPDMVKDGVIILDAGTSEEGGMLRGDADAACATKAALFTPVPGGIGPITVALLLRHVVDLSGMDARP